jgi:hypothetical protein
MAKPETLNEALDRIEELKAAINDQNRSVAIYYLALEQIAAMDPVGQRADDLGRAARTARSAVAAVISRGA